MEKRVKSLLLLAVLSQTMIDTLDEEMGLFKFKTKRIAKAFLDDLLILMNKDFGSPEATHQLIELSQWIVDMFNININAGRMTDEEQKGFQQGWSELLKKYKLEK